MKKRDWRLLILQILKWVFLADGIVFGLLAIGFALNTVVFMERSAKATAIVTELEQHQDDDTGVTFSPVFEFFAPDGNKISAHSSSSSNPPGFEVGEKVAIRYEKSNPSVARISTFWQTWAFETGFGIASVLMLALSFLFNWRAIKHKARKPKLKQVQSLNEI